MKRSRPEVCWTTPGLHLSNIWCKNLEAGAFPAHHPPRETPSRVQESTSQTPARLHRHGNTTFALPLLSQNLLSGEGNSRGWTTIPRGGVGDWVSIGIFWSFRFSYPSTRRRGNYMDHRGENERKVRTFGFYDLPCVVNMRGRCKIDLGHSFRRLRRSTLYRRPIFQNMEGNGARITHLTEAESWRWC